MRSFGKLKFVHIVLSVNTYLAEHLKIKQFRVDITVCGFEALNIHNNGYFYTDKEEKTNVGPPYVTINSINYKSILKF